MFDDKVSEQTVGVTDNLIQVAQEGNTPPLPFFPQNFGPAPHINGRSRGRRHQNFPRFHAPRRPSRVPQILSLWTFFFPLRVGSLGQSLMERISTRKHTSGVITLMAAAFVSFDLSQVQSLQ